MLCCSQADMHHNIEQKRFMKSQTWYRAHATDTHRVCSWPGHIRHVLTTLSGCCRRSLSGAIYPTNYFNILRTIITQNCPSYMFVRRRQFSVSSTFSHNLLPITCLICQSHSVCFVALCGALIGEYAVRSRKQPIHLFNYSL